jgi:hypothetical protein
MNKYHVYLADNYDRSKPFTTDWDYELIGDVFRAEFDEYFAQQEKLAGAGTGKSKQLFKGEYVKRFMISKRINLVDDPASGNLKSVFMLRPGEKKLIDERAKGSLAPRFEYKEKKNKEGIVVVREGFMKFDLVEGSEKKSESEDATFQVSGNDIEYFTEEKPTESLDVVKEIPSAFACEKCGKEFDNARALHAHSLSHKGD